MFRRLQNQTVPITLGVSFFTFGFFVMSNVLNLSDREVVIGLIAGSIGGLTMLIASMWQERKTRLSSTLTAVSGY